jgi:hypothetical protein
VSKGASFHTYIDVPACGEGSPLPAVEACLLDAFDATIVVRKRADGRHIEAQKGCCYVGAGVDVDTTEWRMDVLVLHMRSLT